MLAETGGRGLSQNPDVPQSPDTQPDQAAHDQRERRKAYQREWQRQRYHQNPEPKREAVRRRYHQNPQPTLERNRKWVEENFDQRRRYQREYYLKNREAINKRRRENYQRKKEAEKGGGETTVFPKP
jgi:hypothetical protein